MTPTVAGPSVLVKARDFTLPSKYSFTVNMRCSLFDVPFWGERKGRVRNIELIMTYMEKSYEII
jgi:hypothetical protein